MVDCYDQAGGPIVSLGNKIEIKRNSSIRDDYLLNKVNYLILIGFASRILILSYFIM
jgi:hypothetical protein